MNLSKLISKKDEIKLALANTSFINDGYECFGCNGCVGSCTGGCGGTCEGCCIEQCDGGIGDSLQ